MEGEHTSTIIQLIRSTDLAVIQFKDSHIFFIFPTIMKVGWTFLFCFTNIYDEIKKLFMRGISTILVPVLP